MHLPRGRTSRRGGLSRASGLPRGDFYNLEEGEADAENEIAELGSPPGNSVSSAHGTPNFHIYKRK